MSSAVDICNLALSHIGQKANVSSIAPPEGSAESQHCARFYPMARDTVLEMHEWGFATTRAALAAVTVPDLAAGAWSFAYAYPSDCLSPRMVWLPNEPDETMSQDFIVETLANGSRVIYTNVDVATLKYLRVVTNTSLFTPLFVQTVSWLLASHLAGPITKDLKLKASCFETAIAWLGKAAVEDANARKANAYGAKHVPGAMRARQ